MSAPLLFWPCFDPALPLASGIRCLSPRISLRLRSAVIFRPLHLSSCAFPPQRFWVNIKRFIRKPPAGGVRAAVSRPPWQTHSWPVPSLHQHDLHKQKACWYRWLKGIRDNVGTICSEEDCGGGTDLGQIVIKRHCSRFLNRRDRIVGSCGQRGLFLLKAH